MKHEIAILGLLATFAACSDPEPTVPKPDQPAVHATRPATLRSVHRRDGLANGTTAPDFTQPLVDRDGQLRLYDYVSPDGKGKAKAAMVAFMASWCGYCKKSLPTVKQVADANPDLAVIILAIDDDIPGRVREAKRVKAAGLDVPVVSPDRATIDAWMGASRSIPRFFLLNAVAEVKMQDRGFGDKVRPLLPKQVRYLLSHPGIVRR